MTTRRGLFGLVGAVAATAVAGQARSVEASPVPDLTHLDHLWTTSAGRQIPVRDLEDGHLLNIERMLRGKGLTVVDPAAAKARQWRPIIYEEIVRRGLSPQMDWQRLSEFYYPDAIRPTWGQNGA